MHNTITKLLICQLLDHNYMYRSETENRTDGKFFGIWKVGVEGADAINAYMGHSAVQDTTNVTVVGRMTHTTT